MEFGKLPNVDRVNFGMHPDAAENKDVLGGQPALAFMAYIGPTGYNMKDWVGKWYPAASKDRDFLKAYGKQFNTIEHNTTHYRIPDSATVTRWCSEVPDDFRFCPKVPQLFSHARDLGLSNLQLRVFWEKMLEFGEKMGCCFLQVPPYFEPKNLPMLERFLVKWPASIPLAVEVRHEQFFDQSYPGNTFFDMLQQLGMTSVITDVSGRRDVCHSRLTTRTAMIRFVGNALHPTDYSRVDAWAERIVTWVSMGLESVYFFTHEPDNLLAPELSEYVHRVFLDKIPGAVMRGPAPVPSPGEQGVLF